MSPAYISNILKTSISNNRTERYFILIPFIILLITAPLLPVHSYAVSTKIEQTSSLNPVGSGARSGGFGMETCVLPERRPLHAEDSADSLDRGGGELFRPGCALNGFGPGDPRGRRSIHRGSVGRSLGRQPGRVSGFSSRRVPVRYRP